MQHVTKIGSRSFFLGGAVVLALAAGLVLYGLAPAAAPLPNEDAAVRSLMPFAKPYLFRRTTDQGFKTVLPNQGQAKAVLERHRLHVDPEASPGSERVVDLSPDHFDAVARFRRMDREWRFVEVVARASAFRGI